MVENDQHFSKIQGSGTKLSGSKYFSLLYHLLGWEKTSRGGGETHHMPLKNVLVGVVKNS